MIHVLTSLKLMECLTVLSAHFEENKTKRSKDDQIQPLFLRFLNNRVIEMMS